MASAPRYLTLPQLFEGNLFRIPDYQRGYAWTHAQLGDLWSDLELLDTSTQHFTGMIVVERKDDRYHEQEAQPYRVLEVIDGQQRLTSMVLLMMAVSRELAILDPDSKATAARLRDKYVGSQGWNRLALNADSRTYFEHLLVSGTPLSHTENGSQANLKAALAYFEARIQALAPEAPDRLQALRTLLARLQLNLRFVYYEVDDNAEAGLIFEVMNNRGKPLSQADRLKNYLMYLAHKVGLSQDAIDGIARSWGEVFKATMRAAPSGRASTDMEDRLLRTHWVLYREAEFPKELRGLTISQRIRTDLLIQPMPDSERDAAYRALGEAAIAYTNSLVESANDLAEVTNPGAAGCLSWVPEAQRESTCRDLLSFQRMGHTATTLPILLAATRRLRTRVDLYSRLVSALSVFSFRVYAICNRRGHTARNHFRRLARRLFAASPDKLEAVANQVITEVEGYTRAYGSDDDVEEWLRSEDFYTEHRSHEIRYLFHEYEREICGGQEPQLDWSAFANSKTTQVEHVWPVKLQWLAGKKKKHCANIHRLGNLTITHFNQTLSKKPFAKKKKIYATSSLVIENRLQSVKAWTLDVIQDREDALVAFVLKRWPLTPDPHGETEE